MLQYSIAQIIECELGLASDLLKGISRDANTARLALIFDTRGDIDTVAENVAIVDDDVADVNADAKFDPDILWDVSILHGHAALNFDRTARTIYAPAKLPHHAATLAFTHPPP